MRMNEQISATVPEIEAAAKKSGEFWAVIRPGRRTRKIIGKYQTRQEAEERVKKYRGKVYDHKKNSRIVVG